MKQPPPPTAPLPKVPTVLPFGPLYVAVALVAVAKRIGLSKPLAAAVVKQIVGAEANHDVFDGFTPNEHDVFVATFGKSGTNWLMQMALQTAHRGDVSYDHIHEWIPWPGSPMPLAIELDDPRPASLSPTGLRIIKTHLPIAQVPFDARAKYLTFLRDPKEVVVSAYYFLGNLIGALPELTFDDWFDLAVGNSDFMSMWTQHAAGYWSLRERSNVMVRIYSEALQDPQGTVDEVAEVMGVALDEAARATVIERSSFAYMKAHESQFSPPRNPFLRKADNAKMIRSGKAGNSSELLSADQMATVDRLCQAELARIGSDFPYAAKFLV